MTILQKHWRSAFTIAFVAIFTAFALTFGPSEARMQTGSSIIVFDRYDEAVGYTKVFTMDSEKNLTDLGKGFQPSWSGDGTKIAYAFGNGELQDVWTMNADGTNKQQLTHNYQSYEPAWSPDGTRIAFSSEHEGDTHVYIIDADGSNQVRLNHTAEGVTREYAPMWSPDGSKIIFLGMSAPNGTTDFDYYAADANNSGATTRLTFLNDLWNYGAAISPDNSRLVFRYQHNLHAQLLDGSGALVNLTNAFDQYEDPDYAPNGSKILFVRDGYLHVMNTDGSGIVNLDVAGQRPEWNPTAVVPGPTPTPTPTPTPEVLANLSVQAAVSASTVTVGDQVTITAIASNGGTHDAGNVVLTAQLPSSIAAGNIQTSQGFCTIPNGQLECQLGAVANGSSATVTITATVNSIGFASTQFAVSAAETDPDASNNSATANVTAVGPCAQPVTTPIEITRSQWRSNERDGQDELILTIRNISGQSLDPRLVFVFDNLPQGVTIDPSVVAGYTQCSTPTGSPYLVSFAPNKKEWKPMQTVSVRVLFNNPSRAEIQYDWRLYSGDVNP